MIDCVPETTPCVLDGGSFLHRIPWQHGTRLWQNSERLQEKSTIKDDTHQRRGHNIHTVVSVTAETDFSGKKEELLPRDTTKQRVIPMISDELREGECHVVNGTGLVMHVWK